MLCLKLSFRQVGCCDGELLAVDNDDGLERMRIIGRLLLEGQPRKCSVLEKGPKQQELFSRGTVWFEVPYASCLNTEVEAKEMCGQTIVQGRFRFGEP